MRRYAILVLLGFSAACTSPVPPTVTKAPIAPITGRAEVFLSATEQGPRIRKSLRDAGFEVVSSTGAPYTLVVKVGNGRASMECGAVNNVSYDLRSPGGRVMVMKGRGRTGTCTPNIFDDMSRKLASYFDMPT